MIATQERQTLATGSAADRLLDAAAQSFAAAERCRNGKYLECGRLLQSLLELRSNEGCRRADVLKEASVRLREVSGVRANIHVLLQSWQVHLLLGEGTDHRTLGLPHSGYRALLGLVQRTAPGDAEGNTWCINPAVSSEAALALYRRWTREHPRFGVKDLTVAAGLLLQREPTVSPHGKEAAHRHTDKAADRIAGLVRAEEDGEALLFDAIRELKDDWKPAFGEAIVWALAESRLELSLQRMQECCALALSKLQRNSHVA